MEPIRYLDTAVQAALLAEDPQQAVEALVKAYHVQCNDMAGYPFADRRYEWTPEEGLVECEQGPLKLVLAEDAP